MSDEELLSYALSADEAKWTTLHSVCRDRAKATRLAQLLEEHTTADNPAADAWAGLLRELHPDLVINLPAHYEFMNPSIKAPCCIFVTDQGRYFSAISIPFQMTLLLRRRAS